MQLCTCTVSTWETAGVSQSVHDSGAVRLHYVNGGCRSEQPIGHCLPSAYMQWLHS